jgi:hypothetical protein
MDETTINQLKSLISQKPEILDALGVKKAGRPVGAKKRNVIEPGKVIEIIQPSETVSNEEPIPISTTQAKKMLKRPRTYSEETRKKMLENLQRGRDKLKAQKEQRQAAFQNEVNQAKKEVVIKKYIVKPLQKKPVKEIIKQRSPDPHSEEDDSASSVHATTEYESDAEVYKKLKRKERLIKKANKIQKMATEQSARKSVTVAPPRANPYNPFY